MPKRSRSRSINRKSKKIKPTVKYTFDSDKDYSNVILNAIMTQIIDTTHHTNTTLNQIRESIKESVVSFDVKPSNIELCIKHHDKCINFMVGLNGDVYTNLDTSNSSNPFYEFEDAICDAIADHLITIHDGGGKTRRKRRV